MGKQLKFQSIIICKNKGMEQRFVSNPLYIEFKSVVNMKNVYTMEKYMQIVENCECRYRRVSMFEYLTDCLKSLFC